jgi:hypothetical protein
MYLHANAKLGLAGRLALVRGAEEGFSLRAAAAAFSVSPATSIVGGAAGCSRRTFGRTRFPAASGKNRVKHAGDWARRC